MLRPPAAAHALPTVVEPAAISVRHALARLPLLARSNAYPDSLLPESRARPDNMISELERLVTLHANGTLDEAEFRVAKARLLADSAATPVPPERRPPQLRPKLQQDSAAPRSQQELPGSRVDFCLGTSLELPQRRRPVSR